jgi:hypothetical protein
VGDAAHAVHPLAGQGVNLGFGDARALAEALVAAVETGTDPGDARMLYDSYEAPRRIAVLTMTTALDGIKRIFEVRSRVSSRWRALLWVCCVGLCHTNAAMHPARQLACSTSDFDCWPDPQSEVVLSRPRRFGPAASSCPALLHVILQRNGSPPLCVCASAGAGAGARFLGPARRGAAANQRGGAAAQWHHAVRDVGRGVSSRHCCWAL